MYKRKCKLNGRKIVILGVGFYDYEEAISNELRRHGATVFLYDELPIFLRKGFFSILMRKYKHDFSRQIKIHQKKILDDLLSIQIDYVLVIKGEYLEPWFLDELRRSNAGVQLIAYSWDSLNRCQHFLNFQSHFDRVFTFDHSDAQQNSVLKFRPLFYRSEVSDKVNIGFVKKYDLSFVGWLHHERPALLNNINSWANTFKFRTFFYLYTGLYTKMCLNFRGNSKFVHTKKISYKNYLDIVYNSNVIVDLPHPQQTGLTMRAIEAVGAGKKLITTSKEIVKYDFYDPLNICVINPAKIEIPPIFINSPYIELKSSIRQNYSIESWVCDIFELN